MNRISKILCIVCFASIVISCNTHKNKIEGARFNNGFIESHVLSAPINYTEIVKNEGSSKKMEIISYKDMLDLFRTINYTPEAWQNGIREVPRVYLTIIGDKWGSTASIELTTENKKRLFFRGIAPLVLRSNEFIMIDRNHLEEIRTSFLKKETISKKDQIWLKKLAELYKVKMTENGKSAAILDELWVRVDIIPASLALAQGAEESGWGTSRFAAKGNSIYGQWSWGKDAIIPEKQREELGNYGIASFETLQQSVSSYMLNLNTHNAYTSLRNKRAELRKNDKKITGPVLAEQLTKYSERGEDYVKGLKSLIDYNHLEPTDDAYLANDSSIYLVPAAN